LLLCVAKIGGRVGLRELSEASNLHRGTAHRLASRLVSLGFLEQDEQSRYSLGLRVLELGFAYLGSLDLRSQAIPELERLRSEIDAAVALHILDGVETVYVERLESASVQPILRAVAGGRLPVYSTAVGKAIVAFLPAVQQKTVLDGIAFEAFTRRTVRSRADFEAELGAIKKRGYAISDQEHFEGYRAVAAPILNQSGHAIAGIVASAWLGRFRTVRELREVVGPRVLEAAQRISKRFGWNPGPNSGS
jgi:DNA-binding IclR family transcriptional regulator